METIIETDDIPKKHRLNDKIEKPKRIGFKSLQPLRTKSIENNSNESNDNHQVKTNNQKDFKSNVNRSNNTFQESNRPKKSIESKNDWKKVRLQWFVITYDFLIYVIGGITSELGSQKEHQSAGY